METHLSRGTFRGHILPGTLFIITGIWWAFHVVRSVVIINEKTSHRNKGNGCQTSRIIRMVVFNKPLQTEGMFILFGCVCGIVGGIAATHGQVIIDGEFVHVSDLHHITMYMFFGVTGLIEISSHYCITLAPRREKFFLSVSFAVEGFLFYLHAHYSPPPGVVLIHNLLVFACFSCAFFTFLEMLLPREQFLPLLRVGFTLLQGCWFYQIAFTLFNPFGQPWDMESKSNIFVLAMIFTWYALGIIIFLGGFYCATVKYYHSRSRIAGYAEGNGSDRHGNLTQCIGSDPESVKLLDDIYAVKLEE
ncbi:transmembrane protein 45A-like [Glandiceps talaboti]